MKKVLVIALASYVGLLIAVSVDALPRLQTYIVGGSYQYDFGGYDETWMTSERSFDLKVVGGWNDRPGCTPPTYDLIQTYLVIGVPRGENGVVSVNGMRLSSLENDFDNYVPRGLYLSPLHFSRSPRGNLDLYYYHLGFIDNNQRRAFDYDPYRGFSGGYWGNELAMDVTVSGFSFARFNAAGVDMHGVNYMNPHDRDSSFGAAPTPEPGTLALLGTGLLGLVPILRRRARKR